MLYLVNRDVLTKINFVQIDEKRCKYLQERYRIDPIHIDTPTS